MGKNDATYLLAHVSALCRIVLNTSVISAHTLRWSWFNPENGTIELVDPPWENSGAIAIAPRSIGRDWVIVLEAADVHGESNP